MNASINITSLAIAASIIADRIGAIQRQRFFDEHMLLGLTRTDRPLGVHRVRGGDVNRVDIGIGQ